MQLRDITSYIIVGYGARQRPTPQNIANTVGPIPPPYDLVLRPLPRTPQLSFALDLIHRPSAYPSGVTVSIAFLVFLIESGWWLTLIITHAQSTLQRDNINRDRLTIFLRWPKHRSHSQQPQPHCPKQHEQQHEQSFLQRR